MKYLTLMALLILVGCGSNTEYVVQHHDTPVAQEFEGVYYFDNGGYLEIIMGEDQELTIVREGQALNSVNPNNDTLGTHPAIYYSGLEIYQGLARFSANVNYGVDTYDLEEDVSGRDIEGSHRTDYQFRMMGDKLEITITIYEGTTNNNLNTVVARRVLTSL